MSDFNQAMDIVFKLEGGKVTDEGGETNFGISKNQYPNEDIANMTIDKAKVIYKRDYWDIVKGDQLAWPLSLFVFDAAVNQGCDNKANFATQKMLQKAVGVPQDGILGVQTMQAVLKKKGEFLNATFLQERAMRYIGTRSFDKNGKGWYIRLFRLVILSKG